MARDSEAYYIDDDGNKVFIRDISCGWRVDKYNLFHKECCYEEKIEEGSWNQVCCSDISDILKKLKYDK